MTTADLIRLALTLTALCLATWAALHHAQRNPRRRLDVTHYHATTTRWGIGPVGTGNWRDWRTACGISIVFAGHGYALFRWPEEVTHWPYQPCSCETCLAGDRSGPDSRA